MQWCYGQVKAVQRCHQHGQQRPCMPQQRGACMCCRQLLAPGQGGTGYPCCSCNVLRTGWITPGNPPKGLDQSPHPTVGVLQVWLSMGTTRQQQMGKIPAAVRIYLASTRCVEFLLSNAATHRCALRLLKHRVCVVAGLQSCVHGCCSMRRCCSSTGSLSWAVQSR